MSAQAGIEILRDPNIVWCGPYPCPDCKQAIIKTGNGAPELVLDVEDHNHHYPNFRWMEHACKGIECFPKSGMKTPQTGICFVCLTPIDRDVRGDWFHRGSVVGTNHQATPTP